MNVMRTTVATVVAATLSMSAFSAFAAASLTGAGATFPAPVYAKWADTYQKETGNKVNYQGIGSSGGVKQIIANTVDFGASDAPLADDKLAQEGLFQFPTVIGGVVLAVNLPGVKSGELVLDGKTLGNIYLAKLRSGMTKRLPNSTRARSCRHRILPWFVVLMAPVPPSSSPATWRK